MTCTSAFAEGSFKTHMHTAPRIPYATRRARLPRSSPPPATSEGPALSASGPAGRRSSPPPGTVWLGFTAARGLAPLSRGAGLGGVHVNHSLQPIGGSNTLPTALGFASRSVQGVAGSLLTLKPAFSPAYGLTFCSKQRYDSWEQTCWN